MRLIGATHRDLSVAGGDVGNQVVLNKEEWNVLVDLIATGQLTRQ